MIMQRSKRAAGLAAAAVLVCVGLSAAEPLDPPALAQRKAIVERWIADSALSKQLEVLKLRRTTHPDPAAGDRRAYRLEFRFITKADDQAKAEAEFLKFLNAQARAARAPFPERCFYKMALLLEEPRDEVSVHFYVLGTEYAAYYDSSLRSVVFRQGTNRGPVRRTLTVELTNAPSKNTLTLASGSKETSRAVQQFLESVWAGSNARINFQPIEADYVAVSVTNLRKVILLAHNYWEKVQVSVEIKQVGGGLRLTCYFYGYYAPGLGSRPPAEEAYYDMDGPFQAQLDTYAGNVLSRMQRYLERGRS